MEDLFEQIIHVESIDQILEKYEREATDEKVMMDNREDMHPVATLADEYGGRAQIDVDDGCYVLYLKQPDDTYKKTWYIFPEAHEMLKDLPDPRKKQLVKTKEARGYWRKDHYWSCSKCGFECPAGELRKHYTDAGLVYDKNKFPQLCPKCKMELSYF